MWKRQCQTLFGDSPVALRLLKAVPYHLKLHDAKLCIATALQKAVDALYIELSRSTLNRGRVRQLTELRTPHSVSETYLVKVRPLLSHKLQKRSPHRVAVVGVDVVEQPVCHGVIGLEKAVLLVCFEKQRHHH